MPDSLPTQAQHPRPTARRQPGRPPTIHGTIPTPIQYSADVRYSRGSGAGDATRTTGAGQTAVHSAAEIQVPICLIPATRQIRHSRISLKLTRRNRHAAIRWRVTLTTANTTSTRYPTPRNRCRSRMTCCAMPCTMPESWSRTRSETTPWHARPWRGSCTTIPTLTRWTTCSTTCSSSVAALDWTRTQRFTATALCQPTPTASWQPCSPTPTTTRLHAADVISRIRYTPRHTRHTRKATIPKLKRTIASRPRIIPKASTAHVSCSYMPWGSFTAATGKASSPR